MKHNLIPLKIGDSIYLSWQRSRVARFELTSEVDSTYIYTVADSSPWIFIPLKNSCGAITIRGERVANGAILALP